MPQSKRPRQMHLGFETQQIRHPESKRSIQEWTGALEPNWRVLNGSALECLDLVADSSISCVVTSPPYFWLRDYKVVGQIGLEESVDGYVSAIRAIMRKVQAKLAPDGVVFLNLGDTFYSGKGEPHGKDRKSSKRRMGLRAVDRSGGLGIGLQRKSTIGIPWRVAIDLCLDNWVLRSPIIWYKENCLPEPSAKDRPSRSYEFVFMLVKAKKYYFNRKNLPDDNWAEDVWNIPVRTGRSAGLDTAPFPDELVERCLTVGCKPGGIVLDPFCGSGTTLRVARAQGHPAIGIDLNKSFCEHSVRTLTE